MESILSTQKKTQSNKFEIIGSDHQVLQLVLFPGDSIRTYENCLVYMSANIKKKISGQTLKFEEQYLFGSLKAGVEFINESETIGYIGISKRIGRVIVLSSTQNTDIYFKEENLLAYTPGMNLKKGKRFMGLGNSWSIFNSAEKDLSAQIFLQSSNLLIEKELGLNEEIILSKNSVFAFSSTISFTSFAPSLEHQQSPFIKAKGPGLLYIENKPVKQTIRQSYYIAIFFLMALLPFVFKLVQQL